MLKTFEIDLEEAPAALHEQRAQAEQAEQKLLETVADEFPDEGFNAADCPDAYEEKFYELREQQAEAEARAARIEEFLTDPDQAGDWSHYQFTFTEPSTEDALYIQGRSAALAEQAQQQGETIDERMFGVTQLLERVKEDAPPEAPADLAGSLPQQVGDWLLDQLDELSTGEVEADLGNTSPQEALQNYDNSPPTSPGEAATSDDSHSDSSSSSPTTTNT